ncbi:MAG: GcrA family cell cycle regulator [Janthinobacterium lividum]
MSEIPIVVGAVFGRWEVRSPATPNRWGGAMWNARCSCGTERSVHAAGLRSGSTTGCMPVCGRPGILTNNPWTDAVVEELRRLWPTDASAAEIGRKLGVTKGAVVSKVSRLGLAPRPSPIVAGGTGKPYASRSNGTRPRVRKPRVAVERVILPRAERITKLPTVRTLPPRAGAATGGAVIPSLAAGALPRDTGLAEPVALAPVPAVLSSEPVRLSRLTCVWAEGPRGLLVMCEDRAVHNGRFCPAHQAVGCLPSPSFRIGRVPT